MTNASALRTARILALATLVLALLLPPPAAAQSGTTEEPVVWDGYVVHQAIEFGGRVTDFEGSFQTWQSFVNLDSGPRLLEVSLDMHATEHAGLLFDDLSISNFGYGGDPNNISRFRVSKGKWYSFTGSFRRDLNFWDYNLLANPLNPATSVPSVPIDFSPHAFHISRKMTDLNLTILPQARFRVRLGYARNVSDGPSLSTARLGTETVVTQFWRNGVDQYRFGFDFRFLPRTSISYDQFFHVYKGDNYWLGENFGQFQLAGGIPVDLGIAFNTPANQPCAVPVIDFTTTPWTASASCNGFLAYSRMQPVRTFVPVEQLSFQSNYWKRLDLSGRFVYSSGESDSPFLGEAVIGRSTRTNQQVFTQGGVVDNRRISTTAEFGATLRITDKLRLTDTYRWNYFRSPGDFVGGQTSLFSPNMLTLPNAFNPATCPAVPASCPQHTANSPADVQALFWDRFLSQDIQLNTFQVEYDFTDRVGAYVGHRYRHRDIETRQFDLYELLFFPTLPNRGACAGQPLNPDGSCSVITLNGTGAANVVTPLTPLEPHAEEFEINENSALFGIWLRPTDQLRINFDTEIFYADNTFTRINPRQMQLYKLRAKWSPKDWMLFSFMINLLESRNNVETVNHKQHSRSYNFTSTIAPNDKFSVDMSYSYGDISSQTNICFVASPPPPGLISCGGAFLQDVSFYDNQSHFGSVNFLWKPIPRLTTMFGYTVTDSNGDTLILNPQAPLGPLVLDYHLPSASVAFDFTKRWTGKFAWNYYGYDEDSAPGPTLPRDFDGNVYTMSLRYHF